MATPSILINSCSDYPAGNIVKEILQVETLPQGQTIIENVTGYDWHIDTKYYTAEVKLCLTEERTIGDETFAEAVHAFIVFFNPDKEETFQLVKSWGSYLDQINPEIKMLVCEQCTDIHKVKRLEAQTWCIDNGFELVELSAETSSDSELEDDFVETTGIKRIIQSLHAHTWPNLVLKDSRTTVSPYIRQLMQEEHDAKKSVNNSLDGTAESADCNSEDKDHQSSDNKTERTESHDGPEACDKCDNNDTVENGEAVSDKGVSGAETSKGETENKKPKQQSKEERIDSLLPQDDLKLFEALGNEDPGGESFEKLFERFASMKEKASGLPLEDRKKYAEKVAIAFWQAIGGDEDEIGDLDTED